MIDAAMIVRCADPTLAPPFVEEFLASAGSDDPLAIAVRSGGRLILVPKARTPAEAVEVMRQYLGGANLRVGITQLPLGFAVKDRGELDERFVDACENLKMGTAMFAKVTRIVTGWYGSAASVQVLPQMFEDAVRAWTTGEFEGIKVFEANDPGGPTFAAPAEQPSEKGHPGPDTVATQPQGRNFASDGGDLGTAGMRIDLSRIGVESENVR